MEWSFHTSQAAVLCDVRGRYLECLRRHGRPESPGGTAEFAFDELVGNACRHAPGRVRVGLDWTDVRPVLRVQDEGPGFDLATAVSEGAGGGLRRLAELAGPLHARAREAGGSDVAVVLPLHRAREHPVVPAPDSGAGLPSPEQAAPDGTFGREPFLGAVAVHLAQVNEDTAGPAAAQATVSAVGERVGTRLEEEYRRARALSGPLTAPQLAGLFVTLEHAIGGDFSVESVVGDRIVLTNRRCPFGDAVRQAPSLCRMTAGVLGGIATRNTGDSTIRLAQRIAVGDPRCRVVVQLGPRAGTRDQRTAATRSAGLRAVLAEDAVFLREPLRRALAADGVEVVAQCDSPDDVLNRVATYRPDIAVLDFREAHTARALDVATRIRETHPGTGVLVLAEEVAADHARRLLQGNSGVGYLLKDRLAEIDQFCAAVRSVATGGTAVDPRVVAELARPAWRELPLDDLTPREREVLELLADGLSNDAIADRLVVTKRAVEKHISRIFSKLGLEPTAEHERRVLAALSYLGATT
ncbi:LuxR C-terminal-related transcriptional regulator [Trujillonella humicola]|uniref:LuxR C-terminal-related transcriptional regulator n=1 Tax=Trujillonella humicola TaxID=3383699 RepID=UPI003905E6A0